MSSDDLLPPLPQLDPGVPIGSVQSAFEWYRHVALLAIRAMQISPDSPAYRRAGGPQDAALRGLLNRCARLMAATLRLVSNGKHGEAAQILLRCIVESAVTGSWLIIKRREDSFRRYFAAALRTELVVSEAIERNIADRGGEAWVIEARMLKYRDDLFRLTGIARSEVGACKGLPDFRQRLKDVGFDDQAYTFLQQMGSQAVHGTWSDLVDHYLETKTDPIEFGTRNNDLGPQVPHFTTVALHVCRFTFHVVRYMLSPCPERTLFLSRLRLVERKTLAVARADRPDDFQPPASEAPD